MFGRRRKKDDDYIGPSKGIMKWVNKLVHFVFYPIFHPIWFLCGVVILAILIVAVPAYYGIEFANMPAWYKQKFEQHYSKAEKIINENVVQPLKDKTEGTLENLPVNMVNVKAVNKTPGKEEMIVYSSPQIVGRKMFQRAQEVPVDVQATLKRGMPRQEAVFFKRNDALGLTYLDNPTRLFGRATVVNANELKVAQQNLFLYGIYVPPASDSGLEAMKYLQDNIGDKDVECWIGAYTSDGTATAICFYNEVNINQKLVDLKYSKDVSLN